MTMPTQPSRIDSTVPDPTRNGDEKPPSNKSEHGSMGLGRYTALGNATAMMVIVALLIRADIRGEKKDERLFEVIADNGQRYERLAGTVETHIATQIGETRENRASSDRLVTAVDKNTQATERLVWTLGGAPWPFGSPKKKD